MKFRNYGCKVIEGMFFLGLHGVHLKQYKLKPRFAKLFSISCILFCRYISYSNIGHVLKLLGAVLIQSVEPLLNFSKIEENKYDGTGGYSIVIGQIGTFYIRTFTIILQKFHSLPTHLETVNIILIGLSIC